MKRRWIAIAITLVLSEAGSGVVRADENATLDGNWLVSFTALNGNAFNGRLTVEGSSGKWRSIAQTAMQGKNPCFGHEFPVAVVKGEGAVTTLSISASATLPGCTDFSIKATSTDGKEWSGTVGEGRPVRFERQ